MFEPNFSYTDTLVNKLVKLENAKTLLNFLDLNYTVKHKLVNSAKINDIFYLANSLGLKVSVRDAEKLAGGIKVDGVDEVLFKVIQNFRNVIEFNRSAIVETYSELDYSVLHHLNRLIIGGWRETWEAKFRTTGEQPDSFLDNLYEYRDFGIESDRIEREMFELVDWYKTSVPKISPVVRISILVYRLIELYPFLVGNYLTIIAISDYLLLKNGLASKSFFSVVKVFEQGRADLLQSLDYSRKNYEITFWIENFTEKIFDNLEEIREGVNDFIIQDEKSKAQPFLDLNKRQLKVLRYLQSVSVIKREEYCHIMEVSTMTAFRDLDDLVRKKLIKIEGKGRGTKYKLASM